MSKDMMRSKTANVNQKAWPETLSFVSEFCFAVTMAIIPGDQRNKGQKD